MRPISAGLLALLFLLPGAAAASIPVPVRLVVASSDLHDQAVNRAYARYLAEGRNFLIAEGVDGAPTIYPDALAKCIESTQEAGTCARGEIKPHALNRDYPPVALLAKRKEGSVYTWRCVGAGSEDYWPERQTMRIDLAEAMFGTPEQRASWRRKALDCILAAGTEAGGRVNIARE